MSAVQPDRVRDGRGLAWAACAVGVLYAAVSVYWGLGGMWLVDTVGGSLAKAGRAHSAGAILAVWAAAVLKLIAAALPVMALSTVVGVPRRRQARILAWIAAAVLTLYGLVLTVVGLLAQTGVIHVSRNADHKALAWHAYLWDPWFLVWGLLIAASLVRGGGGPRRREIAPDRARAYPRLVR